MGWCWPGRPGWGQSCKGRVKGKGLAACACVSACVVRGAYMRSACRAGVPTSSGVVRKAEEKSYA